MEAVKAVCSNKAYRLNFSHSLQVEECSRCYNCQELWPGEATFKHESVCTATYSSLWRANGDPCEWRGEGSSQWEQWQRKWSRRGGGHSKIPRGTRIFFSCRSSPKIKNAKSGRKSSHHECCKVRAQENKCWSQESRISNIRLYHRILYVLGICLPGLHGFPNKVGVQEKNLRANLSNRRG